MSKDPAALLYIDTWYKATTEMNADARAYYMDMILHQFDEGSIPSDIEEIANICRVRISEFDRFKQVFEQVLKHKFKQNFEGRLENPFASEILRKRNDFKEKRERAGKLSYLIKYGKSNFKLKMKEINYIKQNITVEELEQLQTKSEQSLNKCLNKMLNTLNGDGDGDIFKNINTLFEKLKKEFGLNAIQEESFLLWLKYKAEKNQPYKETGLRQLIKSKLAETEGDPIQLKSMVEHSIANNYQGLYKPNANNGKLKDGKVLEGIDAV